MKYLTEDVLKKDFFQKAYKVPSVAYISGFVAKKIKEYIRRKGGDCQTCKDAYLHATKDRAEEECNKCIDLSLITEMSNGGLTYPSSSLHYVVSKAFHLVELLTSIPETHDLLTDDYTVSATLAVGIIRKLVKEHVLTYRSTDDTRQEGKLNCLFSSCEDCKNDRATTIVPLLTSTITKVSINNYIKHVNKTAKAAAVTLSLVKKRQKRKQLSNAQYSTSVSQTSDKNYSDKEIIVPTHEQAEKMTAQQLKNECKKFGFNSTGTMPQNLERLDLARSLREEGLLHITDWSNKKRHDHMTKLGVSYAGLTKEQEYSVILNNKLNTSSFLDSLNENYESLAREC